MLLSGGMEPSVKYHSGGHSILTGGDQTPLRQCLAGSLSGAEPSQRVTEGPKGRLSADGNRAGPATGKAGLTARGTSRADAKAERSDPMATCNFSNLLSNYTNDSRINSR